MPTMYDVITDILIEFSLHTFLIIIILNLITYYYLLHILFILRSIVVNLYLY